MKATLYWASWCPCSKMLTATLDGMFAKDELPGLEVNIIDVDVQAQATRDAGVRAVPTLIIERDDEKTVLIGAVSRAKLLQVCA